MQVWCDDDDSGASLASQPSAEPTQQPTTRRPTGEPTVQPTTRRPTGGPTEQPTTRRPTGEPTEQPTTRSPTGEPTQQPTTRSPSESVSNPQEIPPWVQDVIDNDIYCFSEATYDAIDNDIEQIKNGIADPQERSHFLGGIVRLAVRDLSYRPSFSSSSDLTFACSRPMVSEGDSPT